MASQNSLPLTRLNVPVFQADIPKRINAYHRLSVQFSVATHNYKVEQTRSDKTHLKLIFKLDNTYYKK